MQHEPDQSDLDLINNKIEELSGIYPSATVDYGYDPVFNGINFWAKVTGLPGEDQETSSLEATDIESFLAGIIDDLQ
jgi:hypothetical protein